MTVKASLPRWTVPLLAAAGAVLLVVLVMRLDPSVVAQQLSRLAPLLPAVLTLTAVKYVLQTTGWRLVLRPQQLPPWLDAIRATIAGDAVGYVTWAGPFSGEPTRAVLMRHLVPVGSGIAAGAAERLMYNLTAALLVVVVLAILGLSVVPARRAAFWTAAVVFVVASVWISARLIRPSHVPPPLARLLSAVRNFWREHRRHAPALALLCLGQHGVLLLEAYLMLNAMGADPTLATTLAFEAVTKLVNTAGVVVPGRLGISEGGSALLAGALGYEASLGLSLALMRRVRAVIWSGVGLVLLLVEERRARRRV